MPSSREARKRTKKSVAWCSCSEGFPGGARGGLAQAMPYSAARQSLPADVDCSSRFELDSNFKPNSNWFETETIHKMPSFAPTILNKIWICRELNKEQLSLFKLFKIQNGIWIRNLVSSRTWIWINLSKIHYETSNFLWNLGNSLLFTPNFHGYWLHMK
jgi:hypothetical protein